MKNERPYGRGKLSDQDHKVIEQLAERGLKPGQIAMRLKKHQSTVAWFMYTHGLKAPEQTDTPKVYVRNGRTVRGFSIAEDAFVVELRLQDKTMLEIAAAVSEKFGTERSHHTIRCRLKMLAAIEEESDQPVSEDMQ